MLKGISKYITCINCGHWVQNGQLEYILLYFFSKDLYASSLVSSNHGNVIWFSVTLCIFYNFVLIFYIFFFIFNLLITLYIILYQLSNGQLIAETA